MKLRNKLIITGTFASLATVPSIAIVTTQCQQLAVFKSATKDAVEAKTTNTDVMTSSANDLGEVVVKPNEQLTPMVLLQSKHKSTHFNYVDLKNTEKKMHSSINEDGVINFHGDRCTDARMGYVPFKISLKIPANSKKRVAITANYKIHLQSGWTAFKGHAADQFATEIFYFGDKPEDISQHAEEMLFPYGNFKKENHSKFSIYKNNFKSNDKEKWDKNIKAVQNNPEFESILVENDTDKEVTKDLWFGISLASCYRDHKEASTWFDINVTPSLIDLTSFDDLEKEFAKTLADLIEKGQKFIDENNKYLAGSKYEKGLKAFTESLDLPEALPEFKEATKNCILFFIDSLKESLNTTNEYNQDLYELLNNKDAVKLLDNIIDEKINEFFNDEDCLAVYKQIQIIKFKGTFIKSVKNFNSLHPINYEANGKMYGFIANKKTSQDYFEFEEMDKYKLEFKDNNKVKDGMIKFAPEGTTFQTGETYADNNCVSYTGFSVDYVTPAFSKAVHYLKPYFQFQLYHLASAKLHALGKTKYSVELFFFGEGDQHKDDKPSKLLNPKSENFAHNAHDEKCIQHWDFDGSKATEWHEQEWKWTWSDNKPFYTIIDDNTNNPEPKHHKLYFGLSLVTSGVYNNKGSSTRFDLTCVPNFFDANQEITCNLENAKSSMLVQDAYKNEDRVKTDSLCSGAVSFSQSYQAPQEVGNTIMFDNNGKDSNARFTYIPLEQKITVPAHSKATLKNKISLMRQWDPDTRANAKNLKLASTVAGYEFNNGDEQHVPEYIPTRSYVPVEKDDPNLKGAKCIDSEKNYGMIGFSTKTQEYHTYKRNLYKKGQEGRLALDIIGDIFDVISVIDIVGTFAVAIKSLIKFTKYFAEIAKLEETLGGAIRTARYAEADLNLSAQIVERTYDWIKNYDRVMLNLTYALRDLEEDLLLTRQFFLNACLRKAMAMQKLGIARKALPWVTTMNMEILAACATATGFALSIAGGALTSGQVNMSKVLLYNNKFNTELERLPNTLDQTVINSRTKVFENDTDEEKVFTYYSGFSYSHQSLISGSNDTRIKLMVVNDPELYFENI